MSAARVIRAGRSIRDAFAWLTRPPFRVLLILSLLVSLVGEGLGATQELARGELAIVLVFLVIQVYLQIAFVLAAGSSEPDPSADAWLKAAWRRRCFWRFFFTSFLATLAVAFGAVILVVGAFYLGAIVALGQSAAALERRNPIEALFRSAQLSRPYRMAVGIVFGILVLVPGAVVQGAGFLMAPERLGIAWNAIVVVTETMTAVGLIALTKIFVVLGGAPSPPLERMAPVRPRLPKT